MFHDFCASCGGPVWGRVSCYATRWGHRVSPAAFARHYFFGAWLTIILQEPALWLTIMPFWACNNPARMRFRRCAYLQFPATLRFWRFPENRPTSRTCILSSEHAEQAKTPSNTRAFDPRTPPNCCKNTDETAFGHMKQGGQGEHRKTRTLYPTSPSFGIVGFRPRDLAVNRMRSGAGYAGVADGFVNPIHGG